MKLWLCGGKVVCLTASSFYERVYDDEFDDDACRRTVRHLLLTAFLPATSETASQDGGQQQNRER